MTAKKDKTGEANWLFYQFAFILCEVFLQEIVLQLCICRAIMGIISDLKQVSGEGVMDNQVSLRKYALVSATMSAFLTPFMSSSINLAIPAIGEEFQASAVLLGWVVSSYLLASAAFLVPMGRLADIIGRKKVFITGVFLFALFSFLSGLVHNIQTFIVLRVLQGAGSAMILALMLF